MLSETDTQRQGSDTYTSNTSNWYAASGVLVSSATQSWKSGSSTTSNDTTSYGYLWRDGPLTASVTLTNTDGTTQSLYAYDNAGRLTSVTLTGGQRPRTVSLITDLAGEILQRDEASAVSPNPHERRYVFDGVVMGTVSNDGSDNQTFAATLAEGTAARPTTPGPFRSGATSGSAYANFDRQHDAINPTSAASSGQSYTVRAGDTLASIAQAVWGDANLWYMLASANGLGADTALTAGRTLSIPGKVVNRGNTSDTFRPYDPTEALGDVQPNTPTPKPQGKKKNKCGIFGAILLAVVAIAVVVVSQGALTGVAGAILGTGGAVTTGSTILGGALAAAAGSIVSQGVGVATGIQDKFSFKGVALAALSGGVGGGIASVAGNGAIAGSQVLGGIVRGVAGSAITQGIAVATGLQKRFDWVGVAAAGVSGGVIAGVGGAIGYQPGSASAANIGRGVVAGIAGDLANAATRSLAEGSDFGDNVLAGLPDVIAQTVGTVISGALARSRQSAAEKALLEQAQRSADNPTPRLTVDPNALYDDTVIGGSPATAGKANSDIAPGTVIVDREVTPEQYARAQAAANAAAKARPGQSGAGTGLITLDAVDGPLAGPNRQFSQVGTLEDAARYYDGFLGAYEQRGDTAYLVRLNVAGAASGNYDLAAFAGAGSGYALGNAATVSGSGYSLSDIASGIVNTLGLSNFFRPSSLGEIARATSGSDPNAPFNASQPSTVRSWVLQERFADNVSTFFSSTFGSGSTFDRYIGTPVGSALNTVARYTVGPGTPVDTLINKPFYALTGAIANSPLGDPGVIMSLEQSGVGALPGGALSGIRSLNSLRAESLIAESVVINPIRATVSIATDGSAVAGQGESLLLSQIREAGGTLPVSRGQFGVQDIAEASRASGNEVAFFRDRASSQLYLRELGSQMGEIPLNSRLILHTQPGSGFLAVQPSAADRAALSVLGQRSSVIVNSEGTFAIRFRPTNAGGETIRPIGGQ